MANTARISVRMPPSVLDRLVEYARPRRWKPATCALYLIEQGLEAMDVAPARRPPVRGAAMTTPSTPAASGEFLAVANSIKEGLAEQGVTIGSVQHAALLDLLPRLPVEVGTLAEARAAGPGVWIDSGITPGLLAKMFPGDAAALVRAEAAARDRELQAKRLARRR